jgi:hypothetical protein
MGDSKTARDSEEATRIQQKLFGQYAQAGVPIVQKTQGYIRGALDQWEPGYVSSAYDAARAGAGEEAMQAERGLLGRLGSRSGGALLSGLVGATAAGGRAFTEERSAVTASQATNTIAQRNNLLRLLSGQGAQATNLGQGFGGLGLQAIGQRLQGGDPFYEATIGLGSAGAAGYLNWLSNPNTGVSSGMVNPTAGYQRLGSGGLPGG